jgi:hypothetical protein
LFTALLVTPAEMFVRSAEPPDAVASWRVKPWRAIAPNSKKSPSVRITMRQAAAASRSRLGAGSRRR